MFEINFDIARLERELSNKKNLKKELENERYQRNSNDNDYLLQHIFSAEYGTNYSCNGKYMLKYIFNKFQFQIGILPQYKKIHIMTDGGIITWNFNNTDCEFKESKGFYFIYLMANTYVFSKSLENKDGSL